MSVRVSLYISLFLSLCTSDSAKKKSLLCSLPVLFVHLFLSLAHVRDGPFIVKNQIYTHATRAHRYARARVGKEKKRNRGNTQLGQTKKHTIDGEGTARLDGFGGDNSCVSCIWFSESCCTC